MYVDVSNPGKLYNTFCYMYFNERFQNLNYTLQRRLSGFTVNSTKSSKVRQKVFYFNVRQKRVHEDNYATFYRHWQPANVETVHQNSYREQPRLTRILVNKAGKALYVPDRCTLCTGVSDRVWPISMPAAPEEHRGRFCNIFKVISTSPSTNSTF